MNAPPSGHVIVYGVRGVGLRTVEHLHAAKVEVVVAPAGPDDADPVAVALLAAWGVPVVTGRPREALAAAGLDTAAAVICVPDDDLRAMEAALAVRRGRPDVRLVVRMGNAAVARALAEVTGPGSVLDVAGLAAPSIVDACLGRRPRPLVLAGRTFVTTELVVSDAAVPAPRAARPARTRVAGARSRGAGIPDPPDEPPDEPPPVRPTGTTLRERYGELAPIAVVRTDADGRPGETVVCPGRDLPVRAGDRVTFVGTPEQFTARGVAVDLGGGAAPAGAGARSAGAARAAEVEEFGGKPGLLTMLRSLVAEADRALKATLLTLFGLAGVSVLVLHAGYVKPDGSHMTWIDALYFTVETIATVGYGDFNFADQVSWLRIYAIGMMAGGVVLAAIWFALLTELLVSSRISRSFGQRRVGTMKGHVVVVGLGAIGMRVVRELVDRGHRVVVVEHDDDNRHLDQARGLGVPVVVGDATDTAVLTGVNLSSAAAVAVLTSDDLVNVETGLAVRDQLGDRWADVPVVLRVFDRELAGAVHDGFDFRYVRSTEALVAPWFIGAALGLDVLGTFHVGQDAFLVGHVTVAAGGRLDGLAVQQLSPRTRVIAIRRADGRLEHARSTTRLGAGDDAYLVGPYEELLAVLERDALGDHVPS